MKRYITPIKLRTKDQVDIEIRQFGRTVEKITGKPPAFEDRVFRQKNDDSVILALNLEQEDLKTLEKHSKSGPYEIIEREWESLLDELPEESEESFDINAALA
jgi:hypothetical protein